MQNKCCFFLRNHWIIGFSLLPLHPKGPARWASLLPEVGDAWIPFSGAVASPAMATQPRTLSSLQPKDCQYLRQRRRKTKKKRGAAERGKRPKMAGLRRKFWLPRMFKGREVDDNHGGNWLATEAVSMATTSIPDVG